MLNVAFISLSNSNISALNSLAAASCLNYLLNSPVSLRDAFISGSNTLDLLCREFNFSTKGALKQSFYSDYLSPDYIRYFYDYYDKFQQLFNKKPFFDLSNKQLRLYAPPAPSLTNPFDDLTEDISIINLSSRNTSLCESVLRYADLLVINVPNQSTTEIFTDSLRKYYFPYVNAGKRVFFILEKEVSKRLNETPYIKNKILNRHAFILPEKTAMPELTHSIRLGTADEYLCQLFLNHKKTEFSEVIEAVARHILMLNQHPDFL